jgi:hypothetical protein
VDKLRRYFVPALLAVMVGVQVWTVVELVNLRRLNRLNMDIHMMFQKDITYAYREIESHNAQLREMRISLQKDEQQ